MARIAVYGSHLPQGGSLSLAGNQLGRLLSLSRHIVFTGACPGISHDVAQGAFECGGRVIGYSPAPDLPTHAKEFGDPIDVFSELVFVPRDYYEANSHQSCYKYRNISSVVSCDAAIIINGGMGTLNEFSIAYDLGKPIVVWEGSGGIADRIRPLLEGLFSIKDIKRVFYSDSPEAILNSLGVALR